MKQADLPKCPTCGAMPEWRWKEHWLGSCHGTLKCPYEHHKVFQPYGTGAQAKARELLIGKWIKLVQEHTA